jgi:nucleoside-diphosphate-sugar epimerase
MIENQNKFITNDCARSFSGAHKQLQSLKGKTLLVTGGSGFMGSWICELVHYMNHEKKMDIKLFLMARNQARFEQNLPHIANSKNIKFIYSDVTGSIVIPKSVNYIVHAAANPDSRFHASQPFQSMKTVALGTGSILEAATRLSNLENILHVSSSAVYSDKFESKEKFSEDLLNIYRDNKLSNYFSQANIYSETLCAAARSELRLPIVTMRPFTFCGPYQSIDSPWAINNFINDAINKRPIRIHHDGEVVRSYMYGSDLAVWLLVILLHAKNGQIYNVGSSDGYMLKDVAKKVANCFSEIPRIMLNTALVDNNNHSVLIPDVSKAEKELSLRIFTDIDTSVEKSVEWYKKQFKYAE